MVRDPGYGDGHKWEGSGGGGHGGLIPSLEPLTNERGTGFILSLPEQK